ncbi:MAG: DUF1080 domain-containing protein [Candidatus Aminicenantes bacterium]|nr:DUF1080 domain-containing protein [Candidatus Aminicenantes bacterium]
MIEKYIKYGLILLLIMGTAVSAAGDKNGLRMTANGDAEREVRIKKFPIAVQCWTYRKFSFFETLDRVKALGMEYLQPYPGQKLGGKYEEIVFDHHLSEDVIKEIQQKLRETGIRLVAYGVDGIENEKKSMEQVFSFARKLGIRTVVTEPKFDDYALLDRMAREFGVDIAIHNHPQPTKYSQPEVVLEHVQKFGPHVGVCADTGHWMRTGRVPVKALRLLEGRILDVHLKDLDAFGRKEAEDVPFGQGEADIRSILAELTRQNYAGYLTIEHEKEDDALNPEPAIRKGLEYIRSITYYDDYEEILSSYNGMYSKHGWNHYGPGTFELNERTGVLKSFGGMGLLWYAKKKCKDFILELDFKCGKKNTNSGVFLRVPEVPTSDDYIYHSFEIQIYDSGEGIHKTAAVYDAEPPSKDAFRPTGEWNHYKITFKGKHIRVELNGEEVINWEAEPRGKVKNFADEGYIGLQNHDRDTSVYFRNIQVKELK